MINAGINDLFPARAGVILFRTITLPRISAVPRTRGGDPAEGVILEEMRYCSPHARG